MMHTVLEPCLRTLLFSASFTLKLRCYLLKPVLSALGWSLESNSNSEVSEQAWVLSPSENSEHSCINTKSLFGHVCFPHDCLTHSNYHLTHSSECQLSAMLSVPIAVAQ